MRISLSDESSRQSQQYRLPYGKKRDAGTLYIHFGSDARGASPSRTSFKKTIGLRVPSNKVLHSLLEKIGEPLIGTTVIMLGEEEALSSAWEIQDRIGDQLAFVLDDGSSAIGDTTVDLSGDAPEIVREGLGSAKALGL